jgi:AraC family L-rhamnose operon transcriptional activator RhaR
MAEPPVDRAGGLLHFTEGTAAYAGHYVHEQNNPVHTHSFLEIAVVTGGTGFHTSLSGSLPLVQGDVVLLRPGVWHGYERCRALELYNCCFSTDLLMHELTWTRADPIYGYLLWTGPYSSQRRGILTTHLDAASLAECVEHLAALDRLRSADPGLHRGDVLGRLVLLLGCLARAAASDSAVAMDAAAGHPHPAVVRTMRLLESTPEHDWTLSELADEMHLTRGYLVRLFKAATGLPPIAYLARHRVELAATLLLHTDESVTRIGETVGWADGNLFARRFKAHVGLSATQYRTRFGHTQQS